MCFVYTRVHSMLFTASFRLKQTDGDDDDDAY